MTGLGFQLFLHDSKTYVLLRELLPLNSQTYSSDSKFSSLVPLYVITWMFHGHLKIKSLSLSLAPTFVFSLCPNVPAQQGLQGSICSMSSEVQGLLFTTPVVVKTPKRVIINWVEA